MGACYQELGLSEGDPVAAQAVGVLARYGADVSELSGRLHEALPQAQGTFRVRVAEALFVLTHDQNLAEPICELLTGDSHWTEKIDAAIALNAFAPVMKVVQALVHGIQNTSTWFVVIQRSLSCCWPASIRRSRKYRIYGP
jgi:hypothetical protein